MRGQLGRRSLTIWESTQGVYAVQSRVAEVLKLPLARVRVIGHYMGGGFGSKLEAGKYTIIAALLAKLAGRPVQLFLTREETFSHVGNRPPSNMTVKAGVKRDGTLTALEFTVLGTGGAYTAGGTSLVDWLVRDLYTCPNVRTNSTDVFINAGPARPFRAPGHPQGAWALEQMMDALAEAIGMDPVELRLKNIPSFSQAREGNPPYTSTAFKECLEQGAAAFGWEQARRDARAQNVQGHIRRGVGVAGGPVVCRRGPAAFHGDRQALPRRQRQPQHGGERPRHRHQDRDGHGRGRGAGHQAGGHPDRECRHRHHPVRDVQRRQQDGADRGAGRAQRRGAGQAEAAGNGGRRA